MPVLNNPLSKDLNHVLNNKDVSRVEVESFKLEIHGEGQRYESNAIISVDTIEDYQNDISMKRFVKVILPTGDFLSLIVAEKDLLEGTLITRYVDGEVQVTYYRVILNRESNNIQTDDLSNLDSGIVNNEDHRVITLELIPIAIESIYNLRVGGIFKKVKMDDLIYSAMSTQIGKVKLNGRIPVDGISMDQANNDNVYSQVVVPDNTLLFGLPDFLQSRYGVYNSGVGVFLKRMFGGSVESNNLHIYQLYNPDKFDKVKNKLALISSTDRSIAMVEKTVLDEDDTIHIVGELTLNDTHKNVTTTDLKTLGFESMNEDAFIKESVERKEKGPSIDPSKHVNAMLFNRRSSGNDIIVNSDEYNMYESMSDVSKNTGEIVSFSVTSSPHYKFLPGMSVSLLYLKNGKPHSSDGVLLKHHTLTSKVSSSFVNTEYRTVTTLFLFLKSNVYKEF